MGRLLTSRYFPALAACFAVAIGVAVWGGPASLTESVAVGLAGFAAVMAMRNWAVAEEERPLLAEELLGVHEHVDALSQDASEMREMLSEVTAILEDLVLDAEAAQQPGADQPAEAPATVAAIAAIERRLAALEDAAAETDKPAPTQPPAAAALDAPAPGVAAAIARLETLEERLAAHDARAGMMAKALALAVAETRKHDARLDALAGAAPAAPAAALETSETRADPPPAAPQTDPEETLSPLERAAAAMMGKSASRAPDPASEDAAAATATAQPQEPAFDEPVTEEPVAKEPVAEDPVSAEPFDETPVAIEPLDIASARDALRSDQNRQAELPIDAPAAAADNDDRTAEDGDVEERDEDGPAAPQSAARPPASVLSLGDDDGADPSVNPAQAALEARSAMLAKESGARPAADAPDVDSARAPIPARRKGDQTRPKPRRLAEAVGAPPVVKRTGQLPAPGADPFDDPSEHARFELTLRPILNLTDREPGFFETVRARFEDPSAREPGGRSAADQQYSLLFRSVGAVDRLTSLDHPAGMFCAVAAAAFENKGFVKSFVELLELRRAICNRLTLEFTQADLTEARALAPDALARVRDAGFRFGLDAVEDWSINLDELAELGFRYIKLPAAPLLARLRPSEMPGERLLEFRRLGLEIIADKVHSPAQADALARVDIRWALGDGLAPPRRVRFS